MGSVTNHFLKFFRGSGPQGTDPAAPPGPHGRPTRRSSGLGEFTRAIAGREDLCILDLGPTSPRNIAHITNLGHKLYHEDVLSAAQDRALYVACEGGGITIDVARFLQDNLSYQGPKFDAVLCWDVYDYLPEPLVKPVVGRLCSVMKPGGVLLGFFHTKDAGPDALYFRYHIVAPDSMELQTGPNFRLQRVFNNRHIENLFREFASIKFFLSRDNIREVLVVR